MQNRLDERHEISADNAAAAFVAGLVAAATGIRVEAIGGSSRGSARAARARQIAMYLAHTRLQLSFTAAGALFGRDRTTAAHAVRAVEKRRDEPAVDSLIDCLERAVGVWPRSHGGGAAAR